MTVAIACACCQVMSVHCIVACLCAVGVPPSMIQAGVSSDDNYLYNAVCKFKICCGRVAAVDL